MTRHIEPGHLPLKDVTAVVVELTLLETVPRILPVQVEVTVPELENVTDVRVLPISSFCPIPAEQGDKSTPVKPALNA